VESPPGSNSYIVAAFYPGNRTVSIGAHGTPFDIATIRALATDPDLVALLG
jgi:hypothetical protein